ncbi:MAG TPA: hypothetical protein VNP96_11650 [Solirubrobacterales bacterium]|nr:hypothetical protein [Solirubrobacterales bacterium]
MEVDKLSNGEKISAVSAILLFVFMFFDWFGVEVSGVPGFTGDVSGAGGSAWDALDVIPIFLMLAIVVAIGVAVIRLTDADLEPPISLNAVVAALGGLAALLILYRIIDQPGGGGDFGGVEVDVTLKLGIFLGLVAAAGIAYGGYSAMREEGMTFGDVGDRLGGGGTQQPPSGGQPPAGGTPPPPPPPPSGQQPPAPPSQSPPPPPPPPAGQ